MPENTITVVVILITLIICLITVVIHHMIILNDIDVLPIPIDDDSDISIR